jgi:hypothetical protein
MRNKKSFLAVILSVTVFTLSNVAGAQVEFASGDKKIDVMVKEKLFTSYLYGEKLTKPSLFPVKTPSGITVTRGYPLEKIEGESKDHPHHVGVFFTYGEVNGEDFWGNTSSPPQVKHVKVTQMKADEDQATLSTVMHWIGKDGKKLLEEKRTMVFSTGENENIIDFDITLTAQDSRVVFTDTKEGMFAIRVAPWLREQSGKGKYLSSNGDEQEKNVWGKRSKWVRLQGEKDDKMVGITIFNHPTSINYPTYWHARGYGLFAANPLGQYMFQKSRKIENPQALNLTLQPGEKAFFRFRMIIYEGARSRKQLDQQFEAYLAINKNRTKNKAKTKVRDSRFLARQ